mgnify:FL=1
MSEDKTLKNLIRSNKGFTMQDLAIATLIITIFVGLISTLMYSVYKTNVKTNLTSQMATYAVQILEDIDKIPYEEVKPELADEYKSDFSIPESFNISIEVSNYGEGVNNVQDVIKIVKLNISYTILNETEGFSIQKLKIKEM